MFDSGFARGCAFSGKISVIYLSTSAFLNISSVIDVAIRFRTPGRLITSLLFLTQVSVLVIFDLSQKLEIDKTKNKDASNMRRFEKKPLILEPLAGLLLLDWIDLLIFSTSFSSLLKRASILFELMLLLFLSTPVMILSIIYFYFKKQIWGRYNLVKLRKYGVENSKLIKNIIMKLLRVFKKFKTFSTQCKWYGCE